MGPGSATRFVLDFLVLKETLEKSDVPISVFHPLAKLLEGGNTRAASYEVYKDICSSPVSKILFADQAEAVGIKWKSEVVESEVAYQEQESFGEKNTGNNVPKSAQKSEQGNTDILSGHYEIIESLCAAEVGQVGANNL